MTLGLPTGRHGGMGRRVEVGMLYKFKSKATGDVIMMGPQGDAMLRALGREPAPQGIIEPPVMLDAITRLQAAIAADEAERAEAEREAAESGKTLPPRQGVTPRQRLWPMIEMLRRAQAEGHPVVWGV